MTQNILMTYLQALGVKYTATYANKLFDEHPYRYSLLGLSDFLNLYRVPNVGVRINDKNVFRLETPFVAHVANDFAIVEKVTNNKVCYNWKGRYLDSDIENFEKIWDGVALIAEPQIDSIEPDYKLNRWKEMLDKGIQKLFYCLFVICLIFVGWINHVEKSIGLFLPLLCSVIGLQISYFLLQKQMKNQSEYADRLCTLFHQKDCNDILATSVAKIGDFSWSEIGFGYFLSNMILILGFSELVQYMIFINICTLPYTVWSIWYQAKKVKQWCVLCMIIQVSLWVLFILNMTFHNVIIPEITATAILTVILIYAFPVLTVNLLVKNITDKKKIVGIYRDFVSLKGNNDVFVALLKKEKYYLIGAETSQIIFGNPRATLRITILTNPHCEPCGRMHERVEALLRRKSDVLCIQYIFSAFNEELLKSNRFLIAVYLQTKPEERERIYHEWYKTGKYDSDKFFQSHQFDVNDKVETELQKHEQWKEGSGLRATPTILVNGYRLPKQYQLEDLEYQVDAIIE